MLLAKLRALVPDLELETERLVIRRFRESDLDVAIEHELDRRIMKFIRDPQPEDEVVAKARTCIEPWKGEENEWLGLAMTLRGDPTMIGLVAFRVLSETNQSVEIGYRVHPDHQRKGLTLEACRALLTFLFDRAGAHKANAYCVADNIGSARLLEKLGMTLEGTLREHCWLMGKWCDDLAYGMLASDPR